MKQFCLIIALALLSARGNTVDGAIIVSDPGSTPQITQINPDGSIHIISSGGLLQTPRGIGVDGNGDILVVDQTALLLLKVDPITGSQSIVSSGGFFNSPSQFVIEASGQIVVADTHQDNGLIRVDPVTGGQTVVSSFGFFSNPEDVAIDAGYDLIVADTNGIIRVDPITGAQSLIASSVGPTGGDIRHFGIAIDANGDILTAVPNGLSGTGGIVRTDPMTGLQTVVASGFSPMDIAIDENGDFIVVVGSTAAKLLRIDPLTGDQVVLGSAPALQQPLSVTIAIPEPRECNFDNDNECDLFDVNLLLSQGNLLDGVPVSPANGRFDINDDNTIDEADLSRWLENAAVGDGFSSAHQRGDTNLDRDVDITDFNRLAAHFEPNGMDVFAENWHHGNFDGDGDIDITDFNLLASNFAPSGYATSAIPEPSTMLLASLALILVGVSFRLSKNG